MKKHVVFIVNDYLPIPSANGVCISNVVKKLSENDNLEITIICLKSNKRQEIYEKIDEVEIFRFETNERSIRNKIKDYNSKITKSFFLNLVRLYKYLKDILYLTTYDRTLKKCLKEKIVEINDKKKIDYIFPVCFPFESVVAAKETYNDKQIEYTPILFDKYSDSNSLHRNKFNKKLKFKRNLAFEVENIRNSNKVIASYDWKTHITTNWNFQDDFVIYGYPPALIKTNDSCTQKEGFDGKFLFAGSVNKKVRPVKFVVDFFTNLLKKSSNYFIDFYTQGNEKEKLDNFSKSFPNHVTSHSTISKEKITMRMLDSDILVSIGNIDISQTPSKIFEYIGLNKPIVHFYQDNKDPVITILNNYEKGLSISQDYSELENSIDLIKEFIIRVKYDTFNGDNMTNLYKATPEYYAKNIIDLLEI